MPLRGKSLLTEGGGGGGLLAHIETGSLGLSSQITTIFQLQTYQISTADQITTVIFNSYPETATTKDATHARRYPSAYLFVDVKQDTALII